MNDLAMLGQMSVPSWGVILGVVGLGLAITVLIAINKFMVVGHPSDMLVISGKRTGEHKGYRTLIGGRTIVIPILEKVDRLSLRSMQVGLEVKAQAGGGTMIAVTGVANVKVSSDPSLRGNAIERFLGQTTMEMQCVARETLEGGLRAVIGKMTQEEIAGDRNKFVSTFMNEVTDDFCKLGMIIDSVNIQNVQDEQEYLKSIAREAKSKVKKLEGLGDEDVERAVFAPIREFLGYELSPDVRRLWEANYRRLAAELPPESLRLREAAFRSALGGRSPGLDASNTESENEQVRICDVCATRLRRKDVTIVPASRVTEATTLV